MAETERFQIFVSDDNRRDIVRRIREGRKHSRRETVRPEKIAGGAA